MGWFTDDDATAYVAADDEPSLLERARGAVGLQPTRREELVDAVCPNMTFKQRLYGFGICFVAGCVVSLSSIMSFSQLLKGHPAPFAITYTLGNLISVCSTMLLVGPMRQLKRMSEPTRAVAAFVFVSAMVMTLVVALAFHWQEGDTSLPTLLLMVCIIVQALALFWYALSYIPYGRRMCKACCASALEDGG